MSFKPSGATSNDRGLVFDTCGLIGRRPPRHEHRPQRWRVLNAAGIERPALCSSVCVCVHLCMCVCACVCVCVSACVCVSVCACVFVCLWGCVSQPPHCRRCVDQNYTQHAQWGGLDTRRLISKHGRPAGRRQGDEEKRRSLLGTTECKVHWWWSGERMQL